MDMNFDMNSLFVYDYQFLHDELTAPPWAYVLASYYMKPAWRAVLALVLGELDDHLRPPNYGRPLKFIQLG